MKNILNPQKKIFIAFVVQFGYEWTSFSSLYNLCLESKGIIPIVVTGNTTSVHSSISVKVFLNQNKISFISEKEAEAMKDRISYVFISEPYRIDQIEFIKSDTTKILYIPYGSSISDEEYTHSYQYNQYIHNVAWKIFAATYFHKSCYKKYCGKGDVHVEVLGSPKFDLINIHSKNTKYTSLVPAEYAGRRVFLWNVHFGGANSIWSSWEEYSETILTYFANSNDAVLVLRPHPFFFASRPANLAETIKNKILTNKNTILDTNPGYANAVMSSHVMISDGSSLIIDYLTTQKPVLYLRKSNSGTLNSLAKSLIYDFNYVANNSSEIVQQCAALTHPDGDTKYLQRVAMLKSNFVYPQCSDVAKAIMKTILSEA